MNHPMDRRSNLLNHRMPTFTIDINASYWQVLQKSSYMPYAFLGIPLIILGLILSVIIALLWYYAD
jgi:hypothetical protein